MGGYRILSGHKPFVQPSASFLSASHIPPVPVVDVTMDQTMDQTASPPTSSFSVVIDGTPETPASFVWTGPTTFQLALSGFAGVSMVVNLVSQHVDFHGTNGSIVKLPQSVIAFP